jgi:predicted deacylase
MPGPGIYRSEVTFPYPALAGWSWPVVEIVGTAPGPRLAIVAGVHVNETSSIEAAIRLQRTLDPARLRGRVSIMPIVNLPAVPFRSQYVCPLDDKNINFSFPGSGEGTFSEAIAWALLNDWAADADCFVDMHGGDLCENVSHFTIAQTIGDAAFDAENFALARCFDAEIIVRLDPSHLDAPSRSVTGRAGRRQHAAFAEAGRIGLIEEPNVLFHFEGALRIAKHLGMIDDAPPHRREPVIVDRYLWIPAPADAFYRYRVEAGDRVAKGTVLATGENTYGEILAEVLAPESGYVLWTITHALAQKDGLVVGLGVPG